MKKHKKKTTKKRKGQPIHDGFSRELLGRSMVFRTCTQKLCYHQCFGYFMMYRKLKKPTQLMQHMFRTREVEVYMGLITLIWLLWKKKWKCHLFVKKSKEKFCFVSKGCFWCKMMRGIQKSWSQCSTMLPFWEIRSFLKKWLAEICGKK